MLFASAVASALALALALAFAFVLHPVLGAGRHCKGRQVRPGLKPAQARPVNPPRGRAPWPVRQEAPHRHVAKKMRACAAVGSPEGERVRSHTHAHTHRQMCLLGFCEDVDALIEKKLARRAGARAGHLHTLPCVPDVLARVRVSPAIAQPFPGSAWDPLGTRVRIDVRRRRRLSGVCARMPCM